METNNLADTNFYDSIVKNLKDEAKILNERLVKIRSNQNCNSMNEYISTLKSLRETLDLISRYDWETHYSEYRTQHKNEDGTFGEEMKQLAVAEFEIDKETTELFIDALDSVIANPNDDIDYPNEHRRLLYALVDIKMIFEQIRSDFSE